MDTKPYFVEGSDPVPNPCTPMIVLRSPKGWTGPAEVDGHKVEGFWRSHQVPMGGMHSNPEHVRQLEEWMRSYKPEGLFDANGALLPEIQATAPIGGGLIDNLTDNHSFTCLCFSKFKGANYEHHHSKHSC
jgi:phosphoketolase